MLSPTRENGKCTRGGIYCCRITSIRAWFASTDHPRWSLYNTPLASDPISTYIIRPQCLGSELSKQIPRVRIPPPATPNAPPASDISIILQNPSSDSDVFIPNSLPRSSTPRRSLEGKYPNHTSTVPPATSSSTSIHPHR